MSPDVAQYHGSPFPIGTQITLSPEAEKHIAEISPDGGTIVLSAVEVNQLTASQPNNIEKHSKEKAAQEAKQQLEAAKQSRIIGEPTTSKAYPIHNSYNNKDYILEISPDEYSGPIVTPITLNSEAEKYIAKTFTEGSTIVTPSVEGKLLAGHSFFDPHTTHIHMIPFADEPPLVESPPKNPANEMKTLKQSLSCGLIDTDLHTLPEDHRIQNGITLKASCSWPDGREFSVITNNEYDRKKFLQEQIKGIRALKKYRKSFKINELCTQYQENN